LRRTPDGGMLAPMPADEHAPRRREKAAGAPRPPAFRININHVPPEGRAFDFVIDADWIRDQLADCDVHGPWEDGTLIVQVSPVGQNFYVKGKASVRLGLTCVRCLRDAVITFSVPVTIVMVRQEPGGLLPKGGKPELGLLPFAGDEFTLDGEVRESIVVELPMNPTCPGGCSVEDLYKD
jgi:uncharacterized metal-binding protein YceD (DUF177 family)